MEAGSQNLTSQSQRKQQPPGQSETLPTGLSDTHVVQHIQEGLVVTQQEDT